MAKLRSFTYDVKTKNAAITIEDDAPRAASEEKDITVITNVVVENSCENRNRSDVANEYIKPYGLELVDKGEIEACVKPEPRVIQDHMQDAVKESE